MSGRRAGEFAKPSLTSAHSPRWYIVHLSIHVLVALDQYDQNRQLLRINLIQIEYLRIFPLLLTLHAMLNQLT